MNWATLIITLMSLNLSHNIKQTMQNDQLVFNGFDCKVPKKIVSFLTKIGVNQQKLVSKTSWGRKRL